MTRRPAPNPIVLQQISAPQPKLWVVLLCMFVPAWLPTLATKMLILSPLFVAFATDHIVAYEITFFLVQLGLFAGSAAFLSRRFASAIWTPQPSPWRGAAKALFVLLPLLFSNLFFSKWATAFLKQLANVDDEMLADLHQEVWGHLAYGPSMTGVICSSVMIFVAPVLEELVFRGFFVNAVARSRGFFVAIVVSSTGFALMYVPQLGFGEHIYSLCVAGMTYGIIRVYSGSLLFAVFAHWIINAVIFAPKWMIAVMYFSKE